MALTNSQALQTVREKVSADVSPPERFYWEHRMRRNLAYLSGVQHLVQDPFTGQIRQIRGRGGNRPNKRDTTANILLPKVMRAVSSVTEVDADFRVAPNSNSRHDRTAARIGEKVFSHLREQENFEEKRNRATLWAASTGLGVMKITWNPESGESQRIYLLNRQEKREQGYPEEVKVPSIRLTRDQMREKEKNGEFEDVSPGDIRLDVSSSYSFFWDESATDGGLDDADWCAWHSVVPIKKLSDIYGKAKTKNIAPDEGLSHGTLYEQEAAMLHGGQAGLYAPYSPRQQRGERTTVTEYWEKALRRNNYKGRKIVVAGDVVLENIDNPYVPAGIGLPFVIFQWLPRPGSFVSIDLVGQLTDPQRGYNRSNTTMQEVEATNGYPGFIFYKNSGIKVARAGSFPGWVFEVNANSPPPIPLQPPNLPPYIAQNAVNRKMEMDEISGQSDPMQGKTSGQVRGTGGINTLVQQAVKSMGLVIQANTMSVAKVGRMMLQLAAYNYTEKRLIKVMGEDNQWDVLDFMGADLRGNYDVRVLKHPGQNERNPIIFDLVSAGFLVPGNPEHERIVFDAIHLKSPDAFFDDRLANQRNAEMENEQLDAIAEQMEAAGPQGIADMAIGFPEARDFEDHITHIAIHNRQRLSKEYRNWTPQARALADAHVGQHQAYLSAMMQGQVEQEQRANDKGTASQARPRGEGGGAGGRPAAPQPQGGGGATQQSFPQPQQPQQPPENPYA